MGELIGSVVELSIGERGVAHDQRDGIGRLVDLRLEELMKAGTFRERDRRLVPGLKLLPFRIGE
jgi:hypothetical protein